MRARRTADLGTRAWAAAPAMLPLLLLLAGCVVEPEREAQDLLPYLQMPASTSMTIQWRTAVETVGAVRYGRTPSLALEACDPEPAQWHAFTLQDLLPDTEYLYQVSADGEPLGEVYAFRTAPEEDVPFVFAVVGDTMYSHEEKLQVRDRILEDDPSFFVHVGDFAGETGGYEESLWRKHWFEDYQEVMCRIPLIPILGNHEYQGVIVVYFSIPGAAPLFHDYFTAPGNERWYAFDWANARFIVLDANIVEDLKPGCEQLRWLERELAESTDGADDPDWLFACWHEPAFSSGAGSIDLTGNPLRENVVPLMERYGVDLVLYGHDHFYERSIKDGIVYIVSGGGGAAPHPIFPDINPYSQKVVDTYQYMRVSVNRRFVLVESVDSLGTVVDAFSMEKAPDPDPTDGDGPAGPDGGCGCTVVDRPGLLEVPVGVALVLVVIFTLRLRIRHRSRKRAP